MIELYKHYIRLNKNNEITHAFSNAFEQPKEIDILFQETEQIGHETVLKNNGRNEIAGGICMATGDALKAFTDQTSGTCIVWGDEF